MENSATYSFNGVSEHDMDMLFLHAFADDQDFLKYGMPNVHAVITGGSSALRINVPSLDYNRPFEEVDPHDLDICFEAIKELTDVANVFEVAARLGYTDENF